MSGIYTHDRFGRLLVKKLPMKYKVLALRFESFYKIGQQGPDLFFYNLVLSKKEHEPGEYIHAHMGKDFLDRNRDYLLKLPHESAQKAYILGVICHFILDYHIHPYVNSFVTSNCSHFEVETEQDRYYLQKDGKNPLTFKSHQLLPRVNEVAKQIYPVYQSYSYVTEHTVRDSLYWFKWIRMLFYAPSIYKEKFLVGVLKMVGKKNYIGHIMKRTPNLPVPTMNEQLEEVFNKALEQAPHLIENAFQYVYEEKPLDQGFLYNFDGIYLGGE